VLVGGKKYLGGGAPKNVLEGKFRLFGFSFWNRGEQLLISPMVSRRSLGGVGGLSKKCWFNFWGEESRGAAEICKATQVQLEKRREWGWAEKQVS